MQVPRIMEQPEAEGGDALRDDSGGAAALIAELLALPDRRPNDAAATSDTAMKRNDEEWSKVCNSQKRNEDLIAAIKALDDKALGPALEAAARAGRDLKNINLEGRKIGAYTHTGEPSKLDLRRARMIGAKLSKADLQSILFEKAELLYARLDEADLRQTRLIKANLSNASVENANGKSTNLTGAVLDNTKIDGWNLGKASFDELRSMPTARAPAPTRRNSFCRCVSDTTRDLAAELAEFAVEEAMGEVSETVEELVDDAVGGAQEAVAQKAVAQVTEALGSLNSQLAEALPKIGELTQIAHGLAEGRKARVQEALSKQLPTLWNPAGEAQGGDAMAAASAAPSADETAQIAPVVTLRDLLTRVLLDALRHDEDELTTKLGTNCAAPDGVRSSSSKSLLELIRRSSSKVVPMVIGPSQAAPVSALDMHKEVVSLAGVLRTAAERVGSQVAEELTTGVFPPPTDADSCAAFETRLSEALDAKLDDLQAALVLLLERRLMAAVCDVGKSVGKSVGREVSAQLGHGRTLRRVLRCVETAENTAIAKDKEHKEQTKRVYAGLCDEIATSLLQTKSDFDDRGLRATFKQAALLSRMELKEKEKSLTYLLERLAKAEEPIQQQSWEDSLASWQALMDLLPKMKSKRGVAVLEAIFSDRAVLKAMGAGKQFNNALCKELPVEVIKRLKEGLGGHIKKHAFEYRQKIEHEIERIIFIRDLKQYGIGLLGSGFVALFIGISNFVSQMAYDFWVSRTD